ncbi:winged helix-turn-helix domain-containing protein [Pseudoalteromonas sp. C2R02]|nr:winged helix-turn-helix domain-containing protein [Pseudoalteromonas sp. C2R02]
MCLDVFILQIPELAYNNNRDISDRAIASHIKNIRKKIRKINIEQNVIETIYGAGFRFIALN